MEFDSIYKFHAISINSLASLATKAIWFSSQESLNDPFEGISIINEPQSNNEKISQSIKFFTHLISKEKGISEQHARDIALEKYIKEPEQFLMLTTEQAKNENNMARSVARNMGIYSTAADIPKDTHIQVSNMLLWSHYGDGLRGFCIKFNAKKLYQSLIDNNSESNFGWAKVNYVNKPHEINLFSPIDDKNFSYLRQLQKKHDQWVYEGECRIICDKTGYKRFDANAIEKIYIGEKIDPSQERLLLTVIEHNYPDAEIFKVKIDNMSYGVRICKKNITKN
jgi:hypothetical protein